MSQQKIQRMVWAGAIAAVTATGAWYGAGLKTRQEIEQVRFPFSYCPSFFQYSISGAILIDRIDFPSRQVAKKVQEATPEEKIAQLEEIRATYVTKQMGIQRKIDELERRKSGMTREESIQGRERKRNW